MKNLIISGYCYCINSKTTYYEVSLFGQTKESPACVFITKICAYTSGYKALIDMCKQKYCNYFNVDDWNIITMHSIKIFSKRETLEHEGKNYIPEDKLFI